MLHRDEDKALSGMIAGRVDATHDMSTKIAGSVSPVQINTGHVDATQDKSGMVAGRTGGF